MDRFYLIAPALALLVTMVVTLIVFAGLCALGHAPKVVAAKHNQLFGPFFGRFLAWLLGPIERLLHGRVSANAITWMSVALCALTGFAAALGHLGGAVWLYAMAGILDALDGRLARLNNTQTQAGALFDSVSDRWGELFVFTGYAWYLHDSPWLLAVIGAMGGSMMVSYTRARAEGLGLSLAGGMMQRAERIVLVSAGTLVAAWYSMDPESVDAIAPILGVLMVVTALLSSATAINRALSALRELRSRAEAKAVVVAIAGAPVEATPPHGNALPPASSFAKVHLH